MTYATNLLWRQASAIYAAASTSLSLSLALSLFPFLLLTCALSHLKSLHSTKLTGEWKEIAAVLPQLFYIIKQIALPLTSFFICPLSLSLWFALVWFAVWNFVNAPVKYGAYLYMSRKLHNTLRDAAALRFLRIFYDAAVSPPRQFSSFCHVFLMTLQCISMQNSA